MEIICKRVVPSDNTVLSKLSFFDKIKMVFSTWLESDSNELENMTRVSKEDYGLQEDLRAFIVKQADQLDKSSFIYLYIPEKFRLILPTVIDAEKGLGRFYEFESAPYRNSIVSQGVTLKMRKRVIMSEAQKVN